MNLTTAELVYINEAAKAIKQKDFILIDNMMIGLDNIQNILIYIPLDSNFIVNYINGIIINTRALSAFIKTLSLESNFEFSFGNNIIKTISGGELNIGFDNRIADLACNKYRYAVSLDHVIQTMIPETQIDDIMFKIYNMSKADGSIGINYNGFYMTVFPSILPVNKSDKMYLTILKSYIYGNTFIAKFRINKKKFDVITYINYIQI